MRMGRKEGWIFLIFLATDSDRLIGLTGWTDGPRNQDGMVGLGGGYRFSLFRARGLGSDWYGRMDEWMDRKGFWSVPKDEFSGWIFSEWSDFCECGIIDRGRDISRLGHHFTILDHTNPYRSIFRNPTILDPATRRFQNTFFGTGIYVVSTTTSGPPAAVKSLISSDRKCGKDIWIKEMYGLVTYKFWSGLVWPGLVWFWPEYRKSKEKKRFWYFACTFFCHCLHLRVFWAWFWFDWLLLWFCICEGCDVRW